MLISLEINNYFRNILYCATLDRLISILQLSIIILLYTHGKITGVYSDMIKIKKLHNDFIHYGLIEILPREAFKEIAENIDKIQKYILELKSCL
jgi:hypothetical protein